MKITPKEEFLVSLSKIKEYFENEDNLTHTELYEKLKNELNWTMSYSSFYRVFQQEFLNKGSYIETQELKIQKDKLELIKDLFEHSEVKILEKLELIAIQLNQNRASSLKLNSNLPTPKTQSDKQIMESFKAQKQDFEDIISSFENSIETKIQNLTNHFDASSKEKIETLGEYFETQTKKKTSWIEERLKIASESSQSRINQTTNESLLIVSRKVEELYDAINFHYFIVVSIFLFGFFFGAFIEWLILI